MLLMFQLYFDAKLNSILYGETEEGEAQTRGSRPPASPYSSLTLTLSLDCTKCTRKQVLYSAGRITSIDT